MKHVDDRYARHRVIPEIGDSGQERIMSSAVLVIGCGALGSVHTHIMARAGVGRLRIVDSDVAEEVNLQRQILFTEEDVARRAPKALVAAKRLADVNSTIEIEGIHARADKENIENLIEGMDIVLDASDNFETRYLVNDACIKNSIPWVYGGVLGTTGMYMPVSASGAPCMRCIFPLPPDPGIAPSGVTAGILSSAPVVIGGLQCTAAIRFLVDGDFGTPVLTMINLWQGPQQEIIIRGDPDCPCCKKGSFDFLH